MALKSFLALAAICVCMPLSGQDTPSRVTFEVASVKPAAPEATGGPPDRLLDMMQNNQAPGWIQMDKARVTLKRRTLVSLISAAYRVRTDQVSGAPWMSELRYDIEAKIPEGADSKSANEMLQSLLDERFGLKLHRESKEVSGYALAVAKGGPKLTPAGPPEPPAPPMDPEEMKRMREELTKKAQAANKQRMEEIMKDRAASGQAGPAAPGSPGGGFSFSSSRWPMKQATTSDIADRLSRYLHMPIVDQTGLDGKYDLQIDIEQGPGDTPEYAVSQALAKLGLKMESRKVPTAMLVVDKAEKTPTEN
jgi:uncharacterized protein (TIGR03435 family)